MKNPCLRHGCSKCCYNTEMMLTENDVNRIISLGYQDFYYQKDGFIYLKNEDDKCIFLDENGRCKIYPHRPLGCKYYPHIYDYENDEILLDKDCPYRKEFSLESTEELKELVLTILCEREKRINSLSRGPFEFPEGISDKKGKHPEKESK
ncbi:MAG: YkgJ family cysteine cluster protein [Thermoplasmata archaeon]|nr:YkgJ family cysteine cluster protein [Thermoplasmata archaeon]